MSFGSAEASISSLAADSRRESFAFFFDFALATFCTIAPPLSILLELALVSGSVSLLWPFSCLGWPTNIKISPRKFYMNDNLFLFKHTTFFII